MKIEMALCEWPSGTIDFFSFPFFSKNLAEAEVEDEVEEDEYTIVGSAEADPSESKISNESPIGKALLGKVVGDEIDVQVPDGISKIKILEINFIFLFKLLLNNPY